MEMSEEEFLGLFKGGLKDQHRDRALEIFRNYGSDLRCHVVYVLTAAHEKGKMSAVLNALEEHYLEDLRFVPIKRRGAPTGLDAGASITSALFRMICAEILDIGPPLGSC